MTPDPSPSPTRLMIPSPGPTTWDVIAQWVAMGLLTAGVFTFIVFAIDNLFSSEKKQEIKPFYLWIATIAFFGGLLSFFLPIAINSGFGKDDDGPVLRQLILYTTGGVLGVITLGETHRKNNQEKEKNENDHTRQVHAERRSRYTKAVEQLADEKATVRLGGIYTLVGLVDEWLTDDTLNPKERQKEGQVIINNLCSYIRSPFPLALKAEMFEGDSEPDNYEEDFSKDQAAFHEEQDVRRTIFIEMGKRSSVISNKEESDVTVTPRAWSDFDFDFSRAPIFYPLSNLTIEKGNFSSAKLYSNADFSEATFTQNANFSEAIFTQNANFSGTKITQNANFSWTKFTQNANFSWTKFTQNANFSWAKFTQNANFSWAKFTQNANFSGTKFTQDAGFYGATFTQEANFIGATFTQEADFIRATFTQNANFRGTKFTQTANFSRATFTQEADFSRATFSASSPKFVETSEVKFVGISKVLERTFRARFATLPKNQRAYSFTVSEGSFPILLGEAELDGAKYHIPAGTVLFDPDSWDEENQKYTRISNPAEPLDESDKVEEDKSE